MAEQMAEQNFNLSRSSVVSTNQQKVMTVYDFAYADYLALNNFFSEMHRVQADLLNTGKTRINGNMADMTTLAGALVIQFYMEQLDTARNIMSGLSKLGLNVEKQVWKMS